MAIKEKTLKCLAHRDSPELIGFTGKPFVLGEDAVLRSLKSNAEEGEGPRVFTILVAGAPIGEDCFSG